MTTIDIHTHLLSSKVRFDRAFDRFAVGFFARKFGLNPKELVKDPYGAYVKGLIANVRGSNFVDKIVLFGVDAKVDECGRELHRDRTVCATNEEVLAVAQAHPDVVVPFFSVNPLRPDALESVQKYHELGFKGAKFLQNYWGVDTREAKFRAYFEKLKQLNLPLIIHVGNETSVSSVRECESLDMVTQPAQIGVKTICAHMAIRYDGRHPFHAISRDPKHFGEEYFRLLEMLETYPNLYADLSAILTPARARVLPHLSRQSQIHDKLFYGSDFPVPYSAIYNTYDIKFHKRIALYREQNVFDRCVRALLEYFSEDNALWSNHEKLLASG